MIAQEWPTEAERETLRCTRELTAGLAFGLPPDVPQEVVYDSIFAALAPHVARRVAQELREVADETDAWGDTQRFGRMLAFFAVALGLRERADRIESSGMRHTTPRPDRSMT